MVDKKLVSATPKSKVSVTHKRAGFAKKVSSGSIANDAGFMRGMTNMFKDDMIQMDVKNRVILRNVGH